ncbi:hypothetical protein C8R43DRAFT_1044225 [Mycena crocata]|nr:hypothetical protein C8R43DRAFT_1044225 [Mycena crocata]
MSIARDTVLSTTEILSQILAQLPMRDLLLKVPLVCSTWQATILTPALQRALFFQPDFAIAPASPVQNPLLVELFPAFFAPYQKERWHSSTCWPSNASSISRMPWATAPDAFRRADASWRRMLVTQPPPQTLLVTETRRTVPLGISERYATLDGPLRMGVVYDVALPLIDRVVSSFYIRWHRIDDAAAGRGGGVDVTLLVDWTVQFYDEGPQLCLLFYSDAHAPMADEFGEWMEKPWNHYQKQREILNFGDDELEGMEEEIILTLDEEGEEEETGTVSHAS